MMGQNQTNLIKELISEWLDIVDTEYFMGALYELLKLSFESMLDQIQQIIKDEPNALQQSTTHPDKCIHTLKLTRLLKVNFDKSVFIQFQKQDSRVWNEFRGDDAQTLQYEVMAAQLSKFVYFGDLYNVTMSDLMLDPTQIKGRSSNQMTMGEDQGLGSITELLKSTSLGDEDDDEMKQLA